MVPAPKTVCDALEWAARYPTLGYRFVRQDDTIVFWTFPDLMARARSAGAALRDKGISKGDRLALVIIDESDFVVAFLGCMLAGIVPVPLYPPHAIARLRAYIASTSAVLAACRARAVLASDAVRPLLWPLTEGAPTLAWIDSVESLPKDRELGHVDIGPEDLAFIQHTSGSTAVPKGVHVTHANLVANSIAIMRHGLEGHTQDAGACWLPLYHDMGLIGHVIAPLFVPMSVTFMPALSFMKWPTKWFDVIHQYRASITFAPNFAYSLVAKRATDADLDRWDLSCLRVAGCGAEPISPDVLKRFSDRLARAKFPPTALTPCYGLAEATLAVTFKPLRTTYRVESFDGPTFHETGRAMPAHEEAGAIGFVSCGRVFPEHAIRILDEHDNTLPERTTGEIEVHGPSVTAGYRDNPSANADTFVGGSLRTGDLGFLADGELFVTGRKKDLLIINGRNHLPQTIEWVVEDVPGVRKGNVIAFARPSPSGTEELVVVCEARDGDSDELRRAVIRRVADELSLSIADLVVLSPGTLPKTSSGKVRRVEARTRYADGVLEVQPARTPGGPKIALASHLMRAAVSRFRHTIRRALKPDE